jgi:hypothetical protein
MIIHVNAANSNSSKQIKSVTFERISAFQTKLNESQLCTIS